MSSNFSSRAKHFAMASLATLGLSVWTLGSVFGAGGFIAGLMYYTGNAQLGIMPDDESPVALMVLNILVYVVGLAVLLIEPYSIRKLKWRQIRSLVGLGRRPWLRDVGYALIGWGAYMVLTIGVQAFAERFMTWINFDQTQDVGFQALSGSLDIFAAFVMIVIAAPIVEELIFRGYLYGSLRPRMPWWLAAVIVSLLFGLVHGQWNVGLDTFAISLVLCYLRDKTGAIWAGMLIHALKNLVAFYVLFLAPSWLQSVLGL